MLLQRLVHSTPKSVSTAALSMLFAGILAVCVSGCDLGSGGGGGDDDPFPPPVNAVDPNLTGIEPTEGAPGEVVTLSGFNFPAELDANQVTFSDAFGDVDIRAQVLSITATGEFVPGFGDRTLMEVVVPNNVRTGFVNLISTTSRDVFFAGARGFTGAPQVLGVVVGNSGVLGRVTLDAATLTPSPDHIEFIGYNLQTIDACTVRSADGDALIASPDVVPFFPDSPINDSTWELPAGMSAVRVDIPAIPGVLGTPESVCADGDTHAYEFNLSGVMPSDLLAIVAPIRVQFRGPFAEIVPASITGVVLPSGTRGGIVPITYSLFEGPSSSRWDVFPEFETPPGSGVWVECAGALSSSEGRDVIPGGAASLPNIDALIGPGMRHTFFWDTTRVDGGLPVGRNVARVRLRPTNPEEGSSFLPCDSGGWETGPLVIDNGVPTTGAIVETFAADFQEDEDLTTGRWDPSGGVALGITGSDSYFGSGEADIVLEAGESYSFLTDFGEASRDGLDAEDLFLDDENPGADLDPPEFHVRTFIMEEGAILNVIGDAPLVIRVSNPDDEIGVVAAIDGVLDLSGRHGTRPAEAGEVGGLGGEGGPGGGDAGDGGVVTADGGNAPGSVTGQIQPTAGEFGGQAGTNLDIVKPSGSLNNPRPGAGGGGGHARRGDDGRATGGSSMVAPSGRGGGARGDAEMTLILGGGGGGGGAGFPFRSSGVGNLNGRAGGGGGGGGGASLIAVNGQLRVLGQIICDGGLGATGDSGGPPGPGGGGAGGGIKLQATGGIELGADTLLRAMGGEGGRVGASGNVQGGTGSTGRIRLESNGPIGLPGLVNFDNVKGPQEGQFYGRLSDGVDGGQRCRRQPRPE